jgi:probable F420-dependent oxidoreductase
MRIGVIFPQHQAGIGAMGTRDTAPFATDPVAVRDWAQAADDLGFDHIGLYEHVIGPDAARHPDLAGQFTNENTWHEPLVLCGFLAACTRRINLFTSILILPLRETVILAKQAAEVDMLSGGRLRLGVGVGWQTFEYDTVGQDFHTRGARLAEQVAVMKALWTQPSVTYAGRWHTIDGGGIKPLPVQRPIPVIMGGMADATVRRAAWLGDGWIVGGKYLSHPPDDQARRLRDLLYASLDAEGRVPDSVAVYGAMGIAHLPEGEWAARAEAWRQFGATHLLIETVGAGHDSPAEQIRMLSRIKEAVGLQGGP